MVRQEAVERRGSISREFGDRRGEGGGECTSEGMLVSMEVEPTCGSNVASCNRVCTKVACMAASKHGEGAEKSELISRIQRRILLKEHLTTHN